MTLGELRSEAGLDAGAALAALAPEFSADYGALRDLYPLLARAPERLSQPVRLAVVGQIKAGKSTLVNALLGRRLAVTRVVEATYRVNEFRYGHPELIAAYYRDANNNLRRHDYPLSSLEQLTVHKKERTGQLLEPSLIVVRIGESRLQKLILIDTPGLYSIHGVDSDETERLLTRRSSESLQAADAILYLFERDLGEKDMKVVREFLGPPTSSHLINSAKALGVMSRCDQSWRAGQADGDPMTTGAKFIDERWSCEPDLRRIFYEILPVAAIVAEGAQCLSTDEMGELRELSGWDYRKVKKALEYPRSDIFRTRLDGCPIPPDRCVALKEQLGAWGLMLAVSYMRDGCDDATVVARLVDVSGVAKVRHYISSLYEQQAYVMKVSALLDDIRRLITAQERAGIPSLDVQTKLEHVRDAVESIGDNLQGLPEMQISRLIRLGRLDLEPEDAERIDRLAQAHRELSVRISAIIDPHLPTDDSLAILAAAAHAEVQHWRQPRFAARDRETKDAILGAIQIAQAIADRLDKIIELRAEAAERSNRAAELLGDSQPLAKEFEPVNILNRDRQKVRLLAERLAQYAVDLAGGAAPPEGCSAQESLATIDSALSALAEAKQNSDRELQRLASASSSRHLDAAADALARSALVLAELRDRLRGVVAEGDGAAAATLPWVIKRLDEGLAGLQVAEFVDDGEVDVRRHQIVDRRAANLEHPPGTIAQSVRPGLTLAGSLLRPQEVIVFSAEDDRADA